MHSAAIPSTSVAASTSSLASTITATTTTPRHSNNHYHHAESEPRSSVLRQHSDEEKSLKSGSNHHLSSSSTSRPASKARRTSSGGSRIPSEDAAQYTGSQAGSSASDSGGSDWRHGPKSHSTAATSIPIHPSASSSSSTAAASAATLAADATISDGNISRIMEKMPERASTSSNYFNKAALAATSFADGDHGQSGSSSSQKSHLDLAKYPAPDLLRSLAALLAQIAAANDQIRPKGISTPPTTTSSSDSRQKSKDQSSNSATSNNITASNSNSSVASSHDGKGHSKKINGNDVTHSPGISKRPTTAALSALQAPSSTLCFHARNIPSISIESYLLRILKYCPATNEVFLSLLIYFDRMSKMGAPPSASAKSASTASANSEPPGSSENGNASQADHMQQTENGQSSNEDSMHVGMKGFAIDSYNVHRLVIAGVTVASKFFSDVFYTNSRYAKVGGLPVHELNQLELQFLLLNDFKLVIPLEEMQRYADQLLVYGGAPQSTWSDTPQAEDNHRSSNLGGASPRRQGHSDVSMRDG